MAFDHRAHGRDRTMEVAGRTREQVVLLFVARYLTPSGIETANGTVRLMGFPDMFEMELSALPADIATEVENGAVWAPRFPPRTVLSEGLLGRPGDRLASFLRLEESFRPGEGERKSRVLRDGDVVCVFGVWRNGALYRGLRLTKGLPVFLQPPEELGKELGKELGDVGKGLIMLAGILLATAFALAAWFIV